HGAVLVIHAAVARAEEQLRLRPPVDRTAQVRAVHVEDLVGPTGHAADPERGLRGLAGPRERARIVELHERRRAGHEPRDIPHRHVRVLLALEQRGDEVTHDRDADQGGARARQADGDARQEPAAIHLGAPHRVDDPRREGEDAEQRATGEDDPVRDHAGAGDRYAEREGNRPDRRPRNGALAHPMTVPRYTTENTTTHTASTKCRDIAMPSQAGCPTRRGRAVAAANSVASSTSPTSTCSACSPVRVKNVVPNSSDPGRRPAPRNRAYSKPWPARNAAPRKAVSASQRRERRAADTPMVALDANHRALNSAVRPMSSCALAVASPCSRNTTNAMTT